MKNLIYNKMFAELAIVTPTDTTTHQELNFGKLLEPKFRKVFYETYGEIPEQFSQIFHVLSSKKAKETDYAMGAMGEWTKFGSSTTAVTGGTAMPTVPYVKIDAGLERVYTHDEFAQGFMVERKFVDDEMYGIIEKMPRDLARAGRAKVEDDAASIFNNAFTVSGFDAKPLISATHPLIESAAVTDAGTGLNTNLITGTLSDLSLKAGITRMRKSYDEAGKKIQMKADTLVIGASNEWLANELLKSANKAGTTDNDINTILGRLKIVILDYMTDDGRFFLLDSSRHQLNFFWRVKPEFTRDNDFDTLVAKYKGYMRYSYGYSDYRGIVGSQG